MRACRTSQAERLVWSRKALLVAGFMLKENTRKEVAYIDERKQLLSHIELGRIEDKIRQEKKKTKMSSDDENNLRDSLIIGESVDVEHLNESLDRSYLWGTYKKESKE